MNEYQRSARNMKRSGESAERSSTRHLVVWFALLAIFLLGLFWVSVNAEMNVTARQIQTMDGPALRLVINRGDQPHPPSNCEGWQVAVGRQTKDWCDIFFADEIKGCDRTIDLPLQETLAPGEYCGWIELWADGQVVDAAPFDFVIAYEYWDLVPRAVYLADWFTSMALGNHLGRPVDVKMTFYQEDGTPVMTRTITLPAHGCAAFFFHDIPEITWFIGPILLEADAPVRFDYLHTDATGEVWIPQAGRLVRKE